MSVSAVTGQIDDVQDMSISRSRLVGYVVNPVCDMKLKGGQNRFCDKCAISGRKLERHQERRLSVADFIYANSLLQGHAHVTLCGNEPLYYDGGVDDFFDNSLLILRDLHDRHMKRGIVTTGFGLERCKGPLKEVGADISISADGYGDVNDVFRGGFALLDENLQRSHRYLRGKLCIATVLHQPIVRDGRVIRLGNIDALDQMIEWLARYEITEWAFSMFIDYGAVHALPELTDATVEKIYEVASKARKHGIHVMLEYHGKRRFPGWYRDIVDILRVPRNAIIARLGYEGTLDVGHDVFRKITDDAPLWIPDDGDHDLVGAIDGIDRNQRSEASQARFLALAEQRQHPVSAIRL